MEEIIRFVMLARSDRFTLTELCEQFGIGRKTGYKHLTRYAVGGLKGLQVFGLEHDLDLLGPPGSMPPALGEDQRLDVGIGALREAVGPMTARMWFDRLTTGGSTRSPQAERSFDSPRLAQGRRAGGAGLPI